MHQLIAFLKWWMERNTYKPTQQNIAAVIDRYLSGSEGREDGKIIRFRLNGYNYYITRSLIQRRY